MVKVGLVIHSLKAKLVWGQKKSKFLALLEQAKENQPYLDSSHEVD